MVPILHDSTNIQLEFLGKGKLSEAARCVIHEEINGEYYLEMDYPITGPAYKELASGGTIGAIGPIYDYGRPPARRQTRGIEFFDISRISTPINGIVTIRAEHISRRLAKIVCVSSSATLTSAVGSAYPAQPTGGAWFNTVGFHTNVGGTIYLDSPKSALSCMIGDDNSLASEFGGEFAFRTQAPADSSFASVNVAVYHMQHLGSDKGASVHFGIDMINLDRVQDQTNAFNAYVPYWEEGGTKTFASGYVVTPTSPITPIMAVPLDCSQAFASRPTAAQLATYARNLLDSQMPWAGDDSITVDFINGVEITPAGTDVLLGDTVHVFWEAAEISKDLEVVAYDYDVLAERYISIELGTPQTQYVEVSGGGSRSSDSRADSGWQTATLESSFVRYTNGTIPAYRKIGNIVYLRGQIAPAATWDSSTQTTIFTLPDGYRPATTMYFLCQGSTMAHWLLTVNANGSVTASRYGDGTSMNTAVSTQVWMPFSGVSFPVG